MSKKRRSKNRHVDHHYAGRPIMADGPRPTRTWIKTEEGDVVRVPAVRRKAGQGSGVPTTRRPHRPIPPVLAPLGATASPIEVDAAYSGVCPRGGSHTLYTLHIGSRWRLFCSKGCTEGDILKAIGRPRDVLRYRPPAEPRQPTERRFEYVSRDGAPLFEVVRKLDVPSSARGKERFSIKLPDGRRLKPGGYPDAVKGVVYRLGELLRASIEETVFWTEEEKDVEALRDLGLVAVTTSCGAHSYKPSVAHHFRGRRIVHLPDNDPDGQSYADRVANSLRGVAAKFDIVKLPDLPPKGDVSDWLANGGKVEDLLKAAEVPDFFKPVRAMPPPPKAARAEMPLGTVEAAILAAIAAAEHKSLTTDALPMLVAGLPGEEAWNARAREPIVRYPGVPKAELAKARAGISRALGSLARRGLIEKTGRWVRLARSAPSRHA
jgi:hypothetical protein